MHQKQCRSTSFSDVSRPEYTHRILNNHWATLGIPRVRYVRVGGAAPPAASRCSARASLRTPSRGDPPLKVRACGRPDGRRAQGRGFVTVAVGGIGRAVGRMVGAGAAGFGLGTGAVGTAGLGVGVGTMTPASARGRSRTTASRVGSGVG